MRWFTAVLTAIALAAPVFASPAPLHTVQKYAGQTTGRYIVKLKDGVSKANVFGQLKNANITHDWQLIHGFAGELSTAALNTLRASPDVESISEDGIATIVNTQTDATWGLGRISQPATLTTQDASLLTYTYTYDASAGSGVDIYVIDTGIYTAHTQFGGRASWGATFGGYANADGNGHGTHVSGTAAGSQFGVAKNANLIAVKVLSDSGSGAWADVISGLNWVASAVAASGRPSIATMSLGGGIQTSVDSATTALVNAGIHVTVAAGNSNTDAANTSPARAAGVICVGASDITDARAYFSNYGSIVKVFAPGLNVISSWIGSPTATNSISGTSMATPHVAGLVAYLVAKNGNNTPANLITLVQSLAVKGILTNIPAGTINALIQNA